jgi:hypothetical protein
MDLDRENSLVLSLLHAMIGAITPNFRAVSLNCQADGVSICFVLEQDNPEDGGEIDNIVFEFSALEPCNLDLHVFVRVKSSPPYELNIPGRMVYARKEDNWPEKHV